MGLFINILVHGLFVGALVVFLFVLVGIGGGWN